jgi:hypothetical protein
VHCCVGENLSLLLAKYHLTDIGRNIAVLLANPSFLIWHIQAYKDSYNNCIFSRLHIVIKFILYKSLNIRFFVTLSLSLLIRELEFQKIESL